MVVLTDSDPSSPTKSQQAWPPPPGPSQPSSQSPQPHYGAVLRSEDAYFAPPPAYAQNSDASAPLLPGPPQKATPRPSVAKRFCSAFCYAIIILIVLSILKGLSSGGFGFDSISRDNHPRAEDGHVVSCSDVWSGDYTTVQMNGVFPTTIPGYPVFTTSKSYSFPINSSLHYLVARGALSSGVVIVRGSEKADRERIGVEVVVRYHNQQSLNRARICELTKPEGGVGLGIYTPSTIIKFGQKEDEQLDFTVTLTLPISAQSVLGLNAFATKVQNFRHSFEDLGDRVHFEHLSLKGTNGAVEVEDLFVSQGSIDTSNAKINGKLHATDSLVLGTSNGAVEVDVSITNDDTHKASNLILRTSNARISAIISLLTTHNDRPQPKGGHFNVRATTSNGRMDIKLPSSPVDSLLDMEAFTSNGNADVSLHAAYEGSYYLASSGSVEVDNEHARDPSGKGRHRTVINSISTRKLIAGSIFWGNEWDHDKNAETGRVIVSTSNSWARLRLI